MRMSRISALPRSNPSWWACYLLAITALFLLETVTSHKSRRYLWVEEKEEDLTNILPGNEVPQNALELNPMESTGLQATMKRYKERHEAWSRWTTRIYIMLVLLSVSAGTLSLFLPRPFYFSLLVIVVPFVGAFLLARTFGKEED